MPPSRFSQVSRYRNSILSQSKAQDRFSELSLASPADNGVGKLLAVSPVSCHIFARSSTAPNALIVLPEFATRKYGKQPPLVSNASSGQIGDFDTCAFQQDQDRVLLAVGSLQGDLSLQEVRLPEQPSDQVTPLVLPTHESTVTLLKSSTAKPINLLTFHPTCQSLFLTGSNQDSTIHLWDFNKSSAVQEWQGGSPLWDAKWSPAGRQVAGSGKDAVIRLFDPRKPESCISINAHASKVKPSKVTFINPNQAHLLLTTGFSQMRQREIAIWDQRSPNAPLKRITLDVASSALEPVTDYDRGIVYMVAKGESSVRWVDVGSEDQGGNFAEGAHALDFPATSAVLGPAAKCDTGVGEIAKLFITSASGSSGGGGGASASDSIISASVRVPRRTYIDFHSDLYPHTPQRSYSGLDNEKWLKGEDVVLPLISLDPSDRSAAVNGGAGDAVSEQKKAAESTTIPTTLPEAKEQHIAPTTAIPAEPSKEVHTSNPPTAPSSSPPVSAAPSKTVPSPVRPTAVANTHMSPPAPSTHWSRRFLAGTTPLSSSFQNLSSLDISRAPATRMIAVSSKYFFIPIAGPGGRLGVYPLEKEGRLPLQMPSFHNGAALGDFIADPFHNDQIITSAADGVIRLWKVPEMSTDGEDGWPSNLAEEPVASVTLPTTEGSNKVGEICPHPHADGLIAVVPADADGKIHLVDLRQKSVLKSVSVPASGLYGAAWSSDGSVLAAAGKDKKLYILDVRGKSSQAQILGQASTHDSPRPFNVVWIDDTHLLTVGHTTGSLRQLKLFKIDYSAINILSEIAKQNLDTSPSILFPFWDFDTKVLWLWSKGERLVSTFEVQVQNAKEPFLALPAFQHSHPQLGLAFLRKDYVNVKEVEIACSIRLSKEELQRVGWKITRSRPEYFQDDVYPPSSIVQKPVLDAEQWMGGRDAPPITKTSLQPDGMLPLSQAPPVARTSSLQKGPTQKELTDKEREDEMLHNVFEKAKGTIEGKDPNHNEEQAARAPDEDDWDSD